MQIDSPILITGFPRVGKTMIAEALECYSVFIGESNKRKENKVLRELETLEFKNKVEETIISQGYNGGKWMFKSSDIINSWNLWNEAFPNAKYILVKRNEADTIESCAKTSFMNKCDSREGWSKLIQDSEIKQDEMINSGLNVKVIWPERFINSDYSQLYELITWLGLEWDSEIFNKVLSILDPKFWKARNKK